MPRSLKRENNKEKPQYYATVNIASVHLKLEIGCFGGGGLAEKHIKEYRDYSSIFKLEICFPSGTKIQY